MKPLQINDFRLGNLTSVNMGRGYEAFDLTPIHYVSMENQVSLTTPNIFFKEADYSKVTFGLSRQTVANRLDFKPPTLECRYSFKSTRLELSCFVEFLVRMVKNIFLFKPIFWLNQKVILFCGEGRMFQIRERKKIINTLMCVSSLCSTATG